MKLEQDFKTTLQQQQTLEQWAQWLRGVVSTILKPYEDGETFPKAARKFLLKWSFYRYEKQLDKTVGIVAEVRRKGGVIPKVSFTHIETSNHAHKFD